MGVSSRGMTVESLRQRIAFATGIGLKRVLAESLSMTAENLALAGFRGSKGPDGMPWDPVKRKGKPLIDTGNLRASLVTTPNGKGFLIALRAPYAEYQQFGTRPHARAGGILKQNGRGRFVKSGRAGFLTRFKAYTNPGIKPRPMLPQGSADLAPVWMPKLQQTAKQVARLRLKGGA